MNIINGQFITLDDNDNDINAVTIENGIITKFNQPNSKFQTIEIISKFEQSLIAARSDVRNNI